MNVGQHKRLSLLALILTACLLGGCTSTSSYLIGQLPESAFDPNLKPVGIVVISDDVPPTPRSERRIKVEPGIVQVAVAPLQGPRTSALSFRFDDAKYIELQVAPCNDVYLAARYDLSGDWKPEIVDIVDRGCGTQ